MVDGYLIISERPATFKAPLCPEKRNSVYTSIAYAGAVNEIYTTQKVFIFNESVLPEEKKDEDLVSFLKTIDDNMKFIFSGKGIKDLVVKSYIGNFGDLGLSLNAPGKNSDNEKQPVGEMSMHDELFKMVVEKYRPYKEVQSIYFVENNNCMQFDIFLTSEHYNRNLVRELIDIEMEVEDNFPEFELNFEYIPLPHVSKDVVLNSRHKNLFER